jgi:hypothetical protein
MWQRFTERARRMVFYAQEEADLLGTNEVSTEHLLLGLIRAKDHVAARILTGMGISLDRIRSEIEHRAVKGSGSTTGHKQLTPSAIRSIDLAYDEARQLGNNYIGTEHLLLGLIREGEGPAASALSGLGLEGEGLAGRVLADLGVDLITVRREVKQGQEEATAQTDAPDNVLGFPRMGGVKQNLADRLQGKTSEDVPDVEEAAAPMRGDIGVLCNEDGRKTVEFVPEEADLEAFLEVMSLKDEFAYRDLITQGRVILLPGGTGAKFLQRARDGVYRVRLLEGEHAGRVGFVSRKQLQDTRPDDRPFPPQIT